MRLRFLGVLAVLPVVLGLGACGGNADDSGVASGGTATAGAPVSAAPSLDPRDAQLQFAQCMRQNGVNVPDPDPGQPFAVPAGADPAKVRAAQQKCQSILQAGGLGTGSNDPTAQDAMVKLAQCMRAHGVNVPDPKPGQGLKLQAQNVPEEKVKAAQSACQQFQPGSPSGGGK